MIYYDDVNRDGGVFALCLEAFNAFNDSIMVSERHALAHEERQDKIFLAQGKSLLSSPLPEIPVTWKWLRNLNLDHLKIASGFEIIIKSILVEKGFLIQKIINDGRYCNLANKQKDYPVYAQELLKIDDFRFDGLINYLPGITTQSLGFQTILNKPDYRAVLEFSDLDIKLIDEFRTLRNEIHFPMDAISTPVRASYPMPISDFLLSFMNKWIVDRGNLISQTRGWRQRWQMLI